MTLTLRDAIAELGGNKANYLARGAAEHKFELDVPLSEYLAYVRDEPVH